MQKGDTMVRAAIIAIALTTSAAASAQDAPELLICRGTSVGPVRDGSDSTIITDNLGNQLFGTSSSKRTRELDMVVQLRLAGDDPRINLPRIAAPQIASSKGGWYRIKDLEVSRDFIRGKAVFNVFNSSRFEIDRRTGILTSEAGFQGKCEAVATDAYAF